MTGGGDGAPSSNRFSWCITNSQRVRDYRIASTTTKSFQIFTEYDYPLLFKTSVSTWLYQSAHLLYCAPFFWFCEIGMRVILWLIVVNTFIKQIISSPSCHISLLRPEGFSLPFLSLSRVISWLGVLCPAKSLPVRIIEKWLMIHFSCGSLKIQKIRSPSLFWDSRKKNKPQ